MLISESRSILIFINLISTKQAPRQHTSAYASIRQHTSAYVSIPDEYETAPPTAYVSIRQHTSAYVSIRQHTSAYLMSTKQAPPLFDPLISCPVYIMCVYNVCVYTYIEKHKTHHPFASDPEPHTSAYVSIRQHTSAYA